MEGVEWTKLKYTQSGDALRNPLKINNERHDCKIQSYSPYSVCRGDTSE
jgi:hypothetical protein